MVILVHSEMDNDNHRGSKRGLFRWIPSRARNSPPNRRSSRVKDNLPTERRPLRSVPVVGPDCRVEPERLVAEYVEKEAALFGTVPNIETKFDATDRAALLKILDEQQAVGQLKSHLFHDDDIIITFSVHNIKLLRRDGEKLIQRIVTHKIAAVGYVRDDQQHIVFIKFASETNPKMCNLTLLNCKSKDAAEEVCSLARQIFQLVYTDSAIDFLDKSIMVGAITPKNHSYSTDDSEKRDPVTAITDNTEEQRRKSTESLPTSNSASRHGTSNTDVRFRPSTGQLSEMRPRSSSTLPIMSRTHRRSGSSGSSGTNPVPSSSSIHLRSLTSSAKRTGAQAEFQIPDYLAVLQKEFTRNELREFADLLQQFRMGTLTIRDLSVKLWELYTETRKHLLLGMRHFIPNPTDLSYFDQFLKDHQADQSSSDSASYGWWTEAPRVSSSAQSEDGSVSTGAHVTDLSSSESEHTLTPPVLPYKDGGIFDNFVMSSYARPRPTKSANGTPPRRAFHLIDSPFVDEPSYSALHVTSVAAVPSGFGDTSNDSDSETNVSRTSSAKMTPSKDDTNVRHRRQGKERRKSELSSNESKRPSSEHFAMPPLQDFDVRQQKEHRKKKKHKRDSITVAL